MTTVTENNAPAFATTGSATLDLFVKSVRGCDVGFINSKLPIAWDEGCERTLKLICNTRDPRNGKGERDVAYSMLRWLRENKPLTYINNIKRIASEYGRFEDLVELAHLVADPEIELQILAHQLQQDLTSQKPSLAAKWAPTEKGHYSKEAIILAKLLFPQDIKALEKYRKLVLTPLRSKLDVLETKMCANEWDTIDFSHVPSQAMLKYGSKTTTIFDSKSKEQQDGTFFRHEGERFRQYLQDVKDGKAKINTTGIQPHQLVSKYLNNHLSDADETVELQWSTMVKKLQEAGSIGSSMAVVDVSGSMSGEPMTVAIALGLITAMLANGPFKNQIITFHETPQLFKVEGDSLMDKVFRLSRAPWGMSTNFEAVFDLILNTAQMYSVPQDKMVKTLFVFTDMQFNQASSVPEKTLYRVIRSKYAKAGYKIPNIVFWNLRSAQDAFPVQMSQEGTAFVSGFSSDMLKAFMSGIEFTPMSILSHLLAKYQVDVDPSEV